MEVLPVDVQVNVLFPMMYGGCFEDCVANFPIFDVIRTHPRFNPHSALDDVASLGYLDLVKDLVSVGADVRYNRSAALQFAAKNGRLEVVKYLVEMGADFRVKFDYPIRIAAEKGHLEVVKYLVSLGVDPFVDILLGEDEYLEDMYVDIKYGVQFKTLMISACSHGHLEVVKYLVSLGGDIRYKENLPLLCACGGGHLEVVKYLVSLGVDPRAENDDAFITASFSGRLEVVKYLLSMGADLHANEDEFFTELSQGYLCPGLSAMYDYLEAVCDETHTH